MGRGFETRRALPEPGFFFLIAFIREVVVIDLVKISVNLFYAFSHGGGGLSTFFCTYPTCNLPEYTSWAYCEEATKITKNYVRWLVEVELGVT